MDNIDFYKSINEKVILDRYFLLVEMEKNISNSYLEEIKNLNSLGIQRDNLNEMIIVERNKLIYQNFILLYNSLIYKMRIFFNIIDNDENLDKATQLLKYTNQLELKCLKLVKKYLNNSVSLSYIYLYTLFAIKNEILDNYRISLTINDSICNNFNAYIEQNDFNVMKNNLEKINEIIKKKFT